MTGDGRRAGARLDRGQILDAALELVDADGVGGLTMRRLGARLGVDPMAVYHHVGGKHELVIALIERVVAGFALDDSGAAWPARLRGWGRAYRAVVAAHPGLILELLGDRRAVAVAAAAVAGPLRAVLADARVPPDVAEAAEVALVDYVHGAVLPLASAEREDRAAFDAAFEAGLAVVVDGIMAASGRADRPA